MLLLYGVGFLGGIITSLSPCVVPVLPSIVAGSATERRRRPFLIITGLCLTFGAATLFGTWVLGALGLPLDLLRWVGIGLLFALAVGMFIPAVAHKLERPFERLGQRAPHVGDGGLLLGASLGLVFAPCAGPVLSAISAVGASHKVGVTSVFLTITFVIGAAVPLLILALVAQRAGGRWKTFRMNARWLRMGAGVVLFATGLVLALTDSNFLTAAPGYTQSLQNSLENSPTICRQLHALHAESTTGCKAVAPNVVSTLPDLRKAPDFTGVTKWLNTPGDKALSLGALRGKVVLVDFWTYSCINCLRSLPHVEAWYGAYHDDGFVVVGVHTPEFPFEYVVSNVKAEAKSLGVEYPIAVDDKYATWNAWSNNSWPAEYLIDEQGNVRDISIGEGDYATTERDIRLLLSARPGVKLPAATEVANRTPMTELSPESYLGYSYNLTYYAGTQEAYAGSNPVLDKAASYQFPNPFPSTATWALSGTWALHSEEITAGQSAKIELSYDASDVYLVLGGSGTVTVSVNGRQTKTIAVSGIPDLYTLQAGSFQSGTMTLGCSPGIEAYDFTFG